HLLVHVQRPVGERPVADLGLRMADRLGLLGVVLLGLLLRVLDAAAGGEDGGQPGEGEGGSAGTAEEAPPRQPLRLQVLLKCALDTRIGHATPSLATTNVCLGSQASCTSRPGPSDASA